MKICIEITKVYEMDDEKVLELTPCPEDRDLESWLIESFWELCGDSRDEDHIDGSYVQCVEDWDEVDYYYKG